MNVGKVIYALVNSSVPIYPVTAPQGETGTLAVYNVISCVPTNVKERVSVKDIYRVQITVMAETYAALMTAAETIRGLMDYKEGTYGTVPVDLIRFENQIDNYNMETNEFSLSQDYFIRIKKLKI